MAQVNIEEIVDHLSTEFRRALEVTIQSEFPQVEFDSRQLFRAFKRSVRRKCNTWEQVPDHLVKSGS